MSPVRYLAQPILKIGGSKASDKLMEDLMEISVEESLHQPAMFTIAINNDYFPGSGEPWQHESQFSIGKKIEVSFKSSTTEDTEFSTENEEKVIEGEITAIESNFTENAQATMIIRGYDAGHRLHRGRHNRSFQDMTDSDIVNKIIGEVGISSGTVDSTSPAHKYVFQQNQTNMEFLRERAARNGYELFVQDGKLNFRKPKADDTLSLTWLEDIHSFRVRVTSSEQISSVEVRGWDYKEKKAFVSQASSAKLVTETDFGKGSSTSSSFSGKPSSPKVIVVDKPFFVAKEGDVIAQALCNELGGEFVQADATAEGNPKIRPGRVVKLSDMGKYSGKYYVTETHHNYADGIYITEFTVRGLRGGDLLSTVMPEKRLDPGQTLLVGVVSNNKDPEGWSRVRVKFPTLTEEHESNWARVVSIGAGPDRGFDCLPEINDEVLVGFEHGDIHRPYVIGGVWNGKEKTKDKVDNSVVDGKVRLRTFTTRLGHKLQFVEEDKDSSKKGIYMETVDGKKHHLYMNDTEKFIEVKTSGQHYMKLDDENKKIEIKTNGGHTCLMDDSGKKIDVTSTGDMNVKTGTSGKSNKLNVDAGEIYITGTTKIVLKVGPSTIEMTNSGIKVNSPKVEVTGTGGVDIKSPAKVAIEGAAQVNVQSAAQVGIKAGAAMTVQAGGSLSMQAGGTAGLQAGGALNLQTGAAFQLMAGATAGFTAPLIRLNC